MANNTLFIKQTSINFTVKNLSPVRKIKIFGYPILPGQSRDLFSIPYISEADIRHSLVKGELANFIRLGVISIISSSIDLTQFDSQQQAFLIAAGVSNGTSSGSGLTPSQHEILQQLIHFIDDGPAHGFTSGSYKEITGQPFPTSVIWYTDSGKTKKIVEKLITRNGSKIPTSITWNMYDTNGITIIGSITDNIAYISNVLEINKTRTIS